MDMYRKTIKELFGEDGRGAVALGDFTITLSPDCFVQEDIADASGQYKMQVRFIKGYPGISCILTSDGCDMEQAQICWYVFRGNLQNRIMSTGYRPGNHSMDLKWQTDGASQYKIKIQAFIKPARAQGDDTTTIVAGWYQLESKTLGEVLPCNIMDDQETSGCQTAAIIGAAISVGVDVWSHVRQMGFKNINVLSDGYLGGVLFYDAYYKGCKVNAVTGQKQGLQHKRFNAAKGLEFIAFNARCVANMPDCDLLLVADTNLGNDAIEKIAKGKCAVMYCKDILPDLILQKTVVDPIVDFSVARPDVRVLILTNFSMVGDERSEHEKNIANFMSDFLNHKYDQSGDPVFLDVGKSREYVLNSDAPDSYYDDNMLRKYKNQNSKYVNVAGNFRVTSDTPEKPAHTVWMLGSSKIVGSRVSDSETVPSNLQRLLNQYGQNYNVVNAANFYSNCDEQSVRLLHTLPVHSGDIVIIQIMTKIREKFAGSVKVCDLTQTFRRPHPYGDVFFDTGHVNFRGNEIVAGKIYEYLNANDYFATDRQTESLHRQISKQWLCRKAKSCKCLLQISIVSGRESGQL
jgi:hypothetical protein